jgi:hypothetical protein
MIIICRSWLADYFCIYNLSLSTIGFYFIHQFKWTLRSRAIFSISGLRSRMFYVLRKEIKMFFLNSEGNLRQYLKKKIGDIKMIIQLQFSEIMGCANLLQRFLTFAVYCVSTRVHVTWLVHKWSFINTCAIFVICYVFVYKLFSTYFYNEKGFNWVFYED